MVLIRVFIFLFASGGSLSAAEPAAPSSNPCSGDIQKYCGDVTPGQGHLASCMKKHASQLSAGCKKYGKQYAKQHPEVVKGLSKSEGKG
jgi:hypothetical protein